MIDYLLFPWIALFMSILLILGIVVLSKIIKRPAAASLLHLFLAILGWLVFNSLELVDPTLAGTLLWARITYLFIVSTPVLWMLFILDYFGHRRLARFPAALLFWLIPLGALVLVFTNDTHHAFWSSYTFLPVGRFLAFQVGHGPAFFVFWGYAYLLILCGLVLLGWESWRAPRLYRRQSGWVTLGGLVVLVFNLLYMSKAINGWQKDYTPVALALAVLCFLMSIARYQFLKVMPVRKAVLFEALDDGVIVVDPEHVIISVNEAAQRLYQISQDEAIGRKIEVVLPGVKEFNTIIDQADEWHEVCSPSAPLRYFSIKPSPIQDAFKRTWGTMLLVREITHEKQIQLAEKDERRFAQALSDIAAALNSTIHLDDLLDLIIKYVVLVTSCDSANIMMIDDGCAHAVRSLEPLKDWVQIPVDKTANLKWMVENRKPMVMPDVNDFPEWLKIPETQWIRSYVGAPILTKDAVIGFINLDSATPGFYSEKTALRLMSFANHVSIAIQNARNYQKLEELAATDELTGIDNRRKFFEQGDREFGRALRYQRPLTGVMVDLDYFKSINDRFGHLAGDRVLRLLAQACLSEIRDVDLLGRYGGEEFAILLTETDLEHGQNVAERIRAKISRLQLPVAEPGYTITASLGVAQLDGACSQLFDLLDRCDQALYRAKEQGRNRVVVYAEAIPVG